MYQVPAGSDELNIVEYSNEPSSLICPWFWWALTHFSLPVSLFLSLISTLDAPEESSAVRPVMIKVVSLVEESTV